MKQDSNKRGRGIRGQMDRYLSPLDVWGIAFGCIVGWGAFVMPGTTFLPIAGPGGTLIAMGVGALIMVLIGINYAYLMVRYPGTGGAYTYAKETLGRYHAFLCAWFLSLSYSCIVFLNVIALLVVSQTLLGDLLRVGPHYAIAGFDIYLGEELLSFLCLAGIAFLFIGFKPFLQSLQRILAIILLVGAFLITLGILPHLRMDMLKPLFGLTSHEPATVVTTIVLLSPWAFVGFEVISLETAHFHFPMEKTRRLMTLAILLGGLCYAFMVIISVTAVPEGYGQWPDYVRDLSAFSGLKAVPAFLAASTHLGEAGVIILAITALAAILSGIIGGYRATIRVLSNMAEDRILSQRFSSTSFCVIFILLISLAATFLGQNVLDWFVGLTAFGAIVGFGYTSLAAMRLAKEENNKGVQVTGALGTAISLAFLVVQLIPRLTDLETMGAESFLLLAFWCLLGVLFYWRTIRKADAEDFSGNASAGTVLFALLLYSVFMWYALRVMRIAPYPEVMEVMVRNGILAAALLAVGLLVMVYMQRLIRKRHDTLAEEKTHAEESSLAKSQFLFNMSHDIRTPMNAIFGYTNLAQQEECSPALKDYLDKIESSSRHLLDLIGDILEMSRIENGTVELEEVPTDLGELLEELRGLFIQQMQGKGISFTAEAQDLSHPYVLCDKKNLNRVLLNIVSNAYKFTPEGGSIEVTLREEEGKDGAEGRAQPGFEIGAGVYAPLAPSQSYEIRIKDTGIGMSEEFAGKMFTAFEREKSTVVNSIQGTGLGLAITKSILDLMGGTIEVDTALGKGTEFRIQLRFNLCKSDEVEKKEEVAPKEAVSFEGKRLLLVEDNLVNREIARVVLEGLGFEVEDAVNGREAVERVFSLPPEHYDLVLMDIQMPEMDGYEATTVIRGAVDPVIAHIPILAMTANAFEEDRKKAMEMGMNGHVAKPIDMKELTEKLQLALEGKR